MWYNMGMMSIITPEASTSTTAKERLFNLAEEQGLITLADERRLAALVATGRDLLFESPLPPAQEEIRRLAVSARDQLVLHHLRLAAMYASNAQRKGVDSEDLFAAAVMGLLIAAERYDLAKGSDSVRFSTYAGFWMRKKIIQQLQQRDSAPFVVREASRPLLFAIIATAKALEAELRRPPTAEEITTRLNAERSVGRRPLRESRVAALYQMNRSKSLDAPVGMDCDLVLGDLVEDADSPTPQDELQGKDRAALLRQLVEELPVQAKQILYLRFGFTSEGALTLEQICPRYGVTRERVRQIEYQAFRKLRAALLKCDDRAGVRVRPLDQL